VQQQLNSATEITSTPAYNKSGTTAQLPVAAAVICVHACNQCANRSTECSILSNKRVRRACQGLLQKACDPLK
jgi:hypothetical protein